MPKSAYATLLVFVFAISGLAYVLASGPERLPEFDYARYLPASELDAPVKIAVIEDLRCPGCRIAHMEVLPKALEFSASEPAPALVHIAYPVARTDSLALNVLARSYARHHRRDVGEVNDLLFAADSPRLSLEQAEQLLEQRYGAIDPQQRGSIEQAVEKQLREDIRYLRSLGISTVPTVIVNGTVLHGPKAEVLAEHIRAAQLPRRLALVSPEP